MQKVEHHLIESVIDTYPDRFVQEKEWVRLSQFQHYVLNQYLKYGSDRRLVVEIEIPKKYEGYQSNLVFFLSRQLMCLSGTIVSKTHLL